MKTDFIGTILMRAKSFLGYLFQLFLLSLGTLFLERIGFALVHYDSFKNVAPLSTLHSFLIGTFMDCSVVASTLLLLYLPLSLLELLVKRNMTNLFYLLSIFLLALIFFVNLVDIYYFSQYGTRLNMMVSEGVQRYAIIFTLIWKSYPVLRIFGIYGIGIFMFIKFHKRIFLKINAAEPSHWKWIPINSVVLFTFTFFYYGPPFWFLTSFSSSTAANQMASNGVYTFIKAIDQKNIFDRDIAAYEFTTLDSALKGLRAAIIKPDEKSENDYYPSLRSFSNATSIKQKNVVIIMMESFAARNIGCLQGKPLSPNFDRLAKQGMLFTSCFASGVRTQHGLTAVVGSFPPLLGSSLIRRKGFIEFSTLGNIFEHAGYSTHFYHNGHGSYGDTDFFLKQGGFETFLDEKDFKTWHFRNELGVSDDDLFEKIYPEIWSNDGKPKLSLILTMSNHAPHELPADFIESHPETKKLDKKEATFLYSDYALGKFLDKCQQHPDFKNTLFLIIADHGEIYEDADFGFKLFHIPALLLNTSRGNGTFASICSQIDFAPTLLFETGYKGKFNCLGQNLFDKNYRAFAFSKDYESQITLCEDDIAMQWDMRTNAPKYFKIDETKHLTLEEQIPSKAKIEMKYFAENYLQAISYIYRNGRYRLDVNN